jgi:hypothetical protein
MWPLETAVVEATCIMSWINHTIAVLLMKPRI